jgi:UDP-N-acetylmuramate--alanine ligase
MSQQIRDNSRVVGVKAAHRYEVVPVASARTYAGKKFHFIGAGGIGMSGLAKLLLRNDAIVTGSDQAESVVIEQLNSAGAQIRIGHAQQDLDDDIEAVVISAAITDSNPELRAARQKGIRIYKYAEMLGELMNSYQGVAISGTHGKSTVTAWLTFVLKEAQFEPNFIVGADVPQLGGSSGTGSGRYFIAEACEYDRSFLNLRPQVAAVLNIEQDHLDYYRDEAEIVEAFTEFAKRLRPGGVLIANGQDKNVAKLLANLPDEMRLETFGLDSSCTFYADNLALEQGCYAFDIYRSGDLLGRVHNQLPGIHNVLNALAVLAMTVNMGLDAGQTLELLPGFTGIDRRLMLKGRFKGVIVLDDYAHHPTEIRASLKAIRQKYSPKRLWCIFQPHQYSRTRFLLDDFAESFKLADVTIVPEIYFVRDSQESKDLVNAQKLVERICASGSEAIFIDDFEAICDHLKNNVTTGDAVVTMGAGDIWKVADGYVCRLRTNS